MEEYAGKLPEEYEALISLKGIGSYTAGAIASIAYKKAVPAVDGNVLRVISRITESRDDISRQSVRRKMERDLQVIMPQDCPGDFNQALMELGAVICVPNGQAICEKCPAAFACMAYRHGTVDELPVKAPKKARKTENRTVFVIQDGEYTAIRQRSDKGLLAGLYELPNLSGNLSQEEALEYVRIWDLFHCILRNCLMLSIFFPTLSGECRHTGLGYHPWNRQKKKSLFSQIKNRQVNSTQSRRLSGRIRTISRRKRDEAVKYCNSML